MNSSVVFMTGKVPHLGWRWGCQITWHFFKDIMSCCDHWNFTSCLLWLLFRYSGDL